MAVVDDPSATYKLHLPRTFCCGVVFFEVRLGSQHSELALERMIEGHKTLRNFMGGLILRSQQLSNAASGDLRVVQGPVPVESTIGVGKSSILGPSGVQTSSVAISENTHAAILLNWYEGAFSNFAFGLVLRMEGRFNPRMVPSLHGFSAF